MENENIEQVIAENEEALKDAKDAKGNWFTRGFRKLKESIKGFITNHPWLTILICLVGGAGILFGVLCIISFATANKDDDLVEDILDPETNRRDDSNSDDVNIDIDI